jgi:hypothetical protein
MADFNNLLRDQDDSLPAYLERDYDDQNTNDVRSDRDEQDVPPALAQAEAQRRLANEKRWSSLDSPDKSNQGKDASVLFDAEDENVYGPDLTYEKLKVLWIDEINSPDLLPWDDETFSIMSDLLTDCHEHMLVQLRSQARPVAGGGRRSSSSVDPALASLAASICQMDADRVGFILADLCRVRLSKIEKYPLHHVKDSIDRLSDLEVCTHHDYFPFSSYTQCLHKSFY